MATKKPTNTSKTAHVMNLLSKGPDPAPPAGPPAEMAAGELPQVQRSDAVHPPIITTFATDAAISAQIKDALEDTFAEELGIQRKPTASPAQPAPELSPAAAEAAQAPALPLGPEATYVNIMQVLVEEKAPRYIQMLGLCPCSRCAADVKAIALNNLQPKYVVMPVGEVVPRISVYDGQFSSTVTAQLIRACDLVKDHPRHNK